MICYPDSASHTQPDLDQKTMITRLLEVSLLSQVIYFYYYYIVAKEEILIFIRYFVMELRGFSFFLFIAAIRCLCLRRHANGLLNTEHTMTL